MSEKLIPPDLERCQVEYSDWTFMTFGPKVMTRCDKPPTVVATDKTKLHGQMSMCDEHREVFIKIYGKNKVTFRKIKKS